MTTRMLCSMRRIVTLSSRISLVAAAPSGAGLAWVLPAVGREQEEGGAVPRGPGQLEPRWSP